jgi:hypothetical protein
MDASSQKPGADEIRWDRDPYEGWRETVNSWPWLPLGSGDWEKAGNCPRCRDEMTVAKQGSYSKIVEVDRSGGEEITPEEAEGILYQVEGLRQYPARCNCGGEHKGRPPGVKTGCGQWGLIDPPPNDE